MRERLRLFKILSLRQLEDTVASFAGSGKKKTVARGIRMLFLSDALMIFIFAGVLSSAARVMISAGAEELYMTYIVVMALAINLMGGSAAITGGVFAARDNDLLLSMPVDSRIVTAARLSGIYLSLFSSILSVLIPGYVCLFVIGGFEPARLAGFAATALILPLYGIAMSCLPAKITFEISRRVRSTRKNTVSFVTSMVFLALYLVLYTRLSRLGSINASDANAVAQLREANASPVTLIGRAALGSPYLAAVCAVGVAAFAVAAAVISKSLLKGDAPVKAVAIKTKSDAKVFSPAAALLRRDLKRVASSPLYMFNNCIGSVFLILGAVAMLIKGGDLVYYAEALGFEGAAPAFVCAAATLLCSMNAVSAPSVAAEGRTIWISRTLPVSEKTLLRSKVFAHAVITLPPAIIFIVCSLIAVYADWWCYILFPVQITLFVFGSAAIGLHIGLRRCDVSWTSETQLFKQSMVSLVAPLASMAGALLTTAASVAASVLLGSAAGALAALAVGGLTALTGALLMKKSCEKLKSVG